MTTTNSTSSIASSNQFSASQSCVSTPALQHISSTSTGSQGNVRSIDSRTRPSSGIRVSVHAYPGDHVTLLTPVAHNSPLTAATPPSRRRPLLLLWTTILVFCSLYTASGERITTHEFQSKRHRVLAPTLRLVIPSGGSSSSSLPGFALTLPSPISPTQYLSSPVFLPAPRPFTCASYLAASARAPLSSRVPNLPPQRCPHTLFRLTSTIAAPPPSRCCALCSLQHLACDIWWGSRGSMLCAPHLPAAASTQTTRAVYYALRLPLGRREPGCVDSDVVAAIKRQAPRVSSSRSASNSSGVGIESSVSVVTSSSVPLRIKRIFRRAGHVLSALSRVHMIPIRRTVRRIIPRRRVVLRP